MLLRLRPFAPTLLLGFLVVYFAVHALTGDRGLLQGRERSVALQGREVELQRLRAERRDLEARATLLRDGHLSRDLLEERARSLLGFAAPDDYVIRTRA